MLEQDNNKTPTNKGTLLTKTTTVLFIVFIVGVLVYTAYQDFFSQGASKDFPTTTELKEIFSNGYLYLVVGFSCLFIGFLFKGLKNVVMCKLLTNKAHFKTSMETAIIGTYYNNVTPLAVGGQPFEIYHLSKHGVHGGVASAIPIVSFFVNQISFVILTIVGIVLLKSGIIVAPDSMQGGLSTFFLLGIIGCFFCIFVPSLVVLFCIFPKLCAKLVYIVIKIGAKLKILTNPNKTLNKTLKTVIHNSMCMKQIASNLPSFITLFILSFLENFANTSICFFVLKGFGMDIDGLSFFSEWILVIMLCAIIMASITFVPTPGNSGAADLSFFALFSSVLPSGLCFPAMLTWRLFSFYATLLVGFLLTTIKKRADIKYFKAHTEHTNASIEDAFKEIKLPESFNFVIEKQNTTTDNNG